MYERARNERNPSRRYPFCHTVRLLFSISANESFFLDLMKHVYLTTNHQPMTLWLTVNTNVNSNTVFLIAWFSPRRLQVIDKIQTSLVGMDSYCTAATHETFINSRPTDDLPRERVLEMNMVLVLYWITLSYFSHSVLEVWFLRCGSTSGVVYHFVRLPFLV